MSGKRDGEYRQVDSLIAEYAGTWTALFRYDEGVMPAPDGVSPSVRALEYRDAMSDIRRLKDVLMQRGEATELFGQERGDAFKGYWAASSRPCSENRFTEAEKKRRPTFSTSSSRTIRFRMGINGSARSCFCATWTCREWMCG